jgi:hypothetical protein
MATGNQRWRRDVEIGSDPLDGDTRISTSRSNLALTRSSFGAAKGFRFSQMFCSIGGDRLHRGVSNGELATDRECAERRETNSSGPRHGSCLTLCRDWSLGSQSRSTLLVARRGTRAWHSRGAQIPTDALDAATRNPECGFTGTRGSPHVE